MTRKSLKETCRVVGVLMLLGALFVAVFVFGSRAIVLRNRGVDPIRAWPMLAWSVAAGVGMLRCTRWGAAVLTAPPAAMFVWWLAGSLHDAAYTSAVIAVAMSPLFLLPGVIALRNWRQLEPWW